MSKQHGMEMFRGQDQSQLQAMQEMQALMRDPEAMKNWYQSKQKEFESLVEDS
ncbi:MAG: hypothetical protein ABW119_22530 [Candidatus Thiodiazotropha lotti]